MAKGIVIVGASSKRDRFSNKAVRAYAQKGYRVYAVHPREETVEELPAYRSVSDIPDKLDIASLYVRPEIGMTLLDELADKGIRDVYLNPGAESDELYQRARELGLNPMMACSIRAIGLDPDDFPNE
jgi:hypothetical protein